MNEAICEEIGMKNFCNYFLSFFIIITATSLHADRLTIHNNTPRDLYIGILYGMKLPWENEYPKAKLATQVQLLEAQSSGNLERPARRVGMIANWFLLKKNIF